MGQPRPQFLDIFVLVKQNCSEKSVGVSGIQTRIVAVIENKFTRTRAHFTIKKIYVRFFTDFSADARSEKHKITLVATFMDICFSLPRSIPPIAEKRTQKIAGTHFSKFVFYGVYNHLYDLEQFRLKVPHDIYFLC